MSPSAASLGSRALNLSLPFSTMPSLEHAVTGEEVFSFFSRPVSRALFSRPVSRFSIFALLSFLSSTAPTSGEETISEVGVTRVARGVCKRQVWMRCGREIDRAQDKCGCGVVVRLTGSDARRQSKTRVAKDVLMSTLPATARAVGVLLGKNCPANAAFVPFVGASFSWLPDPLRIQHVASRPVHTHGLSARARAPLACILDHHAGVHQD